ncbi:MAG TPA: flagellar hook-associated protein FlgL [Rubrivivax sp.]|nr:flagellar hook-associated protein FlgL [Rubrivivax sp.]
MRITTANAYNTAVDNLQRRQQDLNLAQGRLTSGKRVERASDDPAAAARAERALAGSERAKADQRGVEASRNAMQQVEGALGDATEAMQQIRELLVAAGNATYSDAERANLGDRIRGLRDQLLAIANRGDGAGGYLFGGQGSAQPPFVDGAGGVTFDGTAGQANVQSTHLLPMTHDGGATWLGDTSPAPNLSLFDVLDRVATELRTPGRSNAQVAQTVASGLGDVDAVSARLTLQRAMAGESLNRLDALESRIADSKLHAHSERSLAEDLDMVQALSDFQAQQTGYQAALSTYALVQKMSLFQYL